jgi:hypothetical protein
MSKLSYHADELDDSKTACKVKWEKFEYTKINGKGGKTRTKLNTYHLCVQILDMILCQSLGCLSTNFYEIPYIF